jgi:type I restriction enzyme S subunit
VAQLAKFVNGYPFKPEDLGHEGLPVIRIRQLLDRSAVLEWAQMPSRAVLIDDGDLVFSWSATLAVRWWDRGRALLNQHLFRVDPHPGIHGRWLGYVLTEGIERLRPLMHGSAMTHITREMLRALTVTVPSPASQRAIADYLDTETARIDALIAKKTRMIELVTERKGAAFRRHLDVANGALFSWLGNIPPTWPIVHLRRVARLYMGTTFPHSFQGTSSGDFPFIKVADFASADEQGNIRGVQNWVTRGVAEDLGARIVPAGSILFARVGAALLLNQRRLTTQSCVVDDNVRGLKFHVGDNRFWLLLLELLDLSQIANPGPVPSVNEEQVMSIPVPLPPNDDQRRMADEMESWGRSAARLQRTLKLDIGLLSERRQALVAAAVSGEVPIPGAA